MQVQPEDTPQRGFNTIQAARYIGLSKAFLEKSRTGHTELPGPKCHKFGRRVIYLREDLDAFIEEHLAE